MTDREFFGYDEVVEETQQGQFRNPLHIIADNPKTALVTALGILLVAIGIFFFQSRPKHTKEAAFAMETVAKEMPLKVNLSKDGHKKVHSAEIAEPIQETVTPPEPTTEIKEEVTYIVEESKTPILPDAEPIAKGPAPSEPELVAVPIKKPAPDKEKNIEDELKNIVFNYSKVFNSGQYSRLTPDLMEELMKSIQYRFSQIGKEGNACIDFSVVKGDDDAYDYAKEIKYFLKDQGYDMPENIKQIRVESDVQDVWVWQKNDCVVLTVGNPGK
jgi:hypothetical protein